MQDKTLEKIMASQKQQRAELRTKARNADDPEDVCAYSARYATRHKSLGIDEMSSEDTGFRFSDGSAIVPGRLSREALMGVAPEEGFTIADFSVVLSRSTANSREVLNDLIALGYCAKIGKVGRAYVYGATPAGRKEGMKEIARLEDADWQIEEAVVDEEEPEVIDADPTQAPEEDDTDTDEEQCPGMTKKGTRCKNLASRCHVKSHKA